MIFLALSLIERGATSSSSWSSLSLSPVLSLSSSLGFIFSISSIRPSGNAYSTGYVGSIFSSKGYVVSVFSSKGYVGSVFSSSSI